MAASPAGVLQVRRCQAPYGDEGTVCVIPCSAWVTWLCAIKVQELGRRTGSLLHPATSPAGTGRASTEAPVRQAGLEAVPWGAEC